MLLEFKNTCVFEFCVAESQAKPDFQLAEYVGGQLASKLSTVSSLLDLIQYEYA
jgi:hypothetical protein